MTATSVPNGPPLSGFANQVNDLAFSPDGRRRAVAGLDGTGSIWSLDGSPPIGQPIYGHGNAVVASMATHDGQTLLTASFDGLVMARATTTGAMRWSTDIGEPIWSAALDPTGTRLAVGGANGQLVVLDVTSGSPLHAPTRFPSAVEALAWSPTAPLLAVAAD